VIRYDACDGLAVSRSGPELHFVLDRPGTKNAIDAPMMDTMVRGLALAGIDEAVRVVILRAAGPDFCTGSDIVAKNAPRSTRPQVGSIQRRLPSQAHRLVALLTSIQVPVVCAVRGWVAGLGLHLAVASDFCICTPDTTFWEPFVGRGLTPDSGGSLFVRRRIGEVRARKLLLLGQRVGGVEAAEWGLVHRCVEDGDLEAVTHEVSDALTRRPALAMGLTKWLVQRSWDVPLDQQLADEAFAGELVQRDPARPGFESPEDP
jgi:2-(1,2-epoxy-1,2-dihydrophenyl)acetyl-CoA isomerase